ncbi:MAG: hypothetical protein ACFE9I_01405 [Candidatus Hermodarchaeota archaeon]
MVKGYDTEDEMFEISTRKKKKVVIEEKGVPKHRFRLWDDNPSFKDINTTFSYIKLGFLSVMVMFIIISSYLLFGNVWGAVGFGIFCLVIFIGIFHEEFHGLRYLFRFGTTLTINLFEDFVFWYEKEAPKTLYLSNKKDLIHIALQIYKITVIPEKIHAAIVNFVRAMGSKDIRLSYSYQIVQKPIIPLDYTNISRETALKSLHSKEATIYFIVFYREKGLLTQHKIDHMNYFITKYSNNLKSNLVSNFHHFKTKCLSRDALVNAIRTFFVKTDISSKQNNTKTSHHYINKAHFLGKLSITCILLIYIDIVLFTIKLFYGYILLINSVFIVSFLFIWWRVAFFQITKRRLYHNHKYVVVNPFKNLRVHFSKIYPYTLFIHIDQRVLLGMKMVNLKHVFKSPYCDIGKFIESLNNQNVYFSYTLRNGALEYYYVYKYGLKHMYEKVKKKMLFHPYKRIKNEEDSEVWLGYRAGMWYSLLTMSANIYRFTSKIHNDLLREVENELVRQIDTLKGAFNGNSYGYQLEDLRGATLLSGFLFSCLKYNGFRLNGSHLNYIMMQGTTMYSLTAIADILKKGVEAEIPAEFNTPLYLENFLTIGYTINTEVLESEVPVGFTHDQIKNLLIINGETKQRELICLKIVAELIKVQLPSLIFDYSGIWSKLMSYFRYTRYEQDILYFKYRSAFVIDPISSDIPHDKNQIEYINYMLYAFGLALKKDDRTIEMFRNILQRHPDEDLKTIVTSLKNQSEWEKSPISDVLLSLLSDFSQEDLSYFQSAQTKGIVPNDFIRNNKTVIIDLSAIKELNKKSYLTFTILAKIIHYINQGGKFYEKCIIVPNVDNFFDFFYLDIKRNYDKVDLFLKPLFDNNFGLIVTANQIHYLHANFLLYFHNYITLRATDNRDVSILRNIMNLNELEGTGYYSDSRKNSYQVLYLKNLKDNKVLIRRDDIAQLFPALIAWEDLDESPLMSYVEIVRHMKDQGYDVHFSEKKILEHAKRTIFEIDLDNYYIYVEEVIQFLDYVKTIDQMSLYNKNLKESLKKIIYLKLSRANMKKEHMKKVRDGLLDVLIKQGYLVEHHPRQASGSQTIRTSYCVGERYQQALKEYFKTKGKAQTDINVEIMEKATTQTPRLTDIFKVSQPPRKYIIQKENLQLALMREFSHFHFDIFKMYRYIKHEDYAQVLKIGHDLISQFLTGVYRDYNNMNGEVTAPIFSQFLEYLVTFEHFPFTLAELHNYIEKYKLIDVQAGGPLAIEVYQFLYIFFIRILNYIYKGYNNNGINK